MREPSVFADETGGQGGHSHYYAVTLVFHDQRDTLRETIHRYETSLVEKGLPDVPLHAGPLLTGHEEYEHMSIVTRKALLVSFFILLQHLPVQYHTFLYRRSEYPNPQTLSARMRRDLVIFLFDNLGFFQRYDTLVSREFLLPAATIPRDKAASSRSSRHARGCFGICAESYTLGVTSCPCAGSPGRTRPARRASRG